MTPPVHAITWMDSGVHIDHGWGPRQSFMDAVSKQGMTVISVGMVMHEDDDVVLIGQTYDPGRDSWIAGQAIAKSNIIERRALT